ncbi:hypothetical protein NDU88_004603 [Pleurodeles waltl]|uniref:Uncharacterized protein n=1 Tax=Pleurodeles waltl TaxID=8319 RepID=A0AAV7QG22_PLEWA|nr:hypothetical protein NDU88_004603 [Pleurodeles waltl]
MADEEKVRAALALLRQAGRMDLAGGRVGRGLRVRSGWGGGGPGCQVWESRGLPLGRGALGLRAGEVEQPAAAGEARLPSAKARKERVGAPGAAIKQRQRQAGLSGLAGLESPVLMCGSGSREGAEGEGSEDSTPSAALGDGAIRMAGAGEGAGLCIRTNWPQGPKGPYFDKMAYNATVE